MARLSHRTRVRCGRANKQSTRTISAAIGISVVKGRVFDDRDSERGEPVVIINETLARKYFPGQDPINRRIKHGTPTQNATWMRVVGVVWPSVPRRG